MLQAPLVPAIVLPRSTPLSMTATVVPACAVPEMFVCRRGHAGGGARDGDGAVPVTTGAGGAGCR